MKMRVGALFCLAGCSSMSEPRSAARLLAGYTEIVRAAGDELASGSQAIARARLENVHYLERAAEELEHDLALQRVALQLGNRSAILAAHQTLMDAMKIEHETRTASIEREARRFERVDALEAAPGFNLDELSAAGRDLAELAKEKEPKDELLFQSRFWFAAASSVSAALKDLKQANQAAAEAAAHQ